MNTENFFRESDSRFFIREEGCALALRDELKDVADDIGCVRLLCSSC